MGYHGFFFDKRIPDSHVILFSGLPLSILVGLLFDGFLQFTAMKFKFPFGLSYSMVL